jgi:hypothetical protein
MEREMRARWGYKKRKREG